jgi:hypothetical protein
MVYIPITSCILVQLVRDVTGTGFARIATRKEARESILRSIEANGIESDKGPDGKIECLIFIQSRSRLPCSMIRLSMNTVSLLGLTFEEERDLIQG